MAALPYPCIGMPSSSADLWTSYWALSSIVKVSRNEVHFKWSNVDFLFRILREWGKQPTIKRLQTAICCCTNQVSKRIDITFLHSMYSHIQVYPSMSGSPELNDRGLDENPDVSAVHLPFSRCFR